MFLLVNVLQAQDTSKYEFPPVPFIPSDKDLVFKGQVYAAVRLGNGFWMIENLNFDLKGSYCYNDYNGNCKVRSPLHLGSG